jgi:hypothetical protein
MANNTKKNTPKKPRAHSLSRGEDHLFRPRIDWWFLLYGIAVVLFITATIPLTIWNNLAGPWVTGVTVIILIVFALTYIDALLYTTYTLTKEGLVVSSVLHHAEYPYSQMRELRKTGLSSLISFGGSKRHALSRKALTIMLRGNQYSSATVSPADREGFMAALLEKIEYDRSHRASRGMNYISN